MDVRAARALVNFLADGVRGYWPDSTRDAWTELVHNLHDTQSAEAAVIRMVNTWTGKGEPSFGDFKQVYDSEVRTADSAPSLDAGKPKRVSMLEYLVALQCRAEDGDRAARVEFANWRKTLSGPFAAALPLSPFELAEAQRLADDHPPSTVTGYDQPDE